MNLKKSVTSALALTLIVGGVLATSNANVYANEIENNTAISMENSSTKTLENGDVVIENESAQLILSPIGGTVEDKDGLIKDLGPETYSSTSFSVDLGSTVTKNYSAKLMVRYSGVMQQAATASVAIKVKCTGSNRIQATSSVSNLKKYNGFSASSSTSNGSNSSTSTTSATLTGSKGSTKGSQTFKSRNVITSSSGSAQGYRAHVTQSWTL